MTKLHLHPAYVLLALAVAVCGCSRGKGVSDRQLAKADQLIKAGDYETAEVELLNMFRGRSPDPRVATRLGVVYQNQGKSKAGEYLSYAVHHLPDDIQARLAFAQFYKDNQSLGTARKHALSVLEKSPGHPQAMLLLAETTAPQQAQQTLAVLDGAPASAKQSAAFHVARAYPLMQSRQMGEAKQEIDQALKIDPRYSPAFFAQASWHLSSRQPNAVLENLKAAAEHAPLRSMYRMIYASQCLAQGDTNSAMFQLQEVTTKAPDYVPAWALLSRAHAASGSVPAALAAAEKALALDPGSILNQMWRGELMLAAKHPDARKVLEQVAANLTEQMRRRLQTGVTSTNVAASTTPGTTNQSAAASSPTNQPPAGAVPGGRGSLPSRLVINLAKAYLLEGNTNRAVSYLNELLLSATNNIEAGLLLATLQLQGRAGDVDLAAETLKRLLKVEPNNAQARGLLAKAYERQSNPELAVVEMNRLISNFPTNLVHRLEAGDIWLRAGQVEKARQYYETALTLSPTNSAAVMRLVSVDSRQGKHDAAITRARQYCEQAPGFDSWYLLYSTYVARINQAQSKGAAPASEDLAQAEAALRKTIELRDEPRVQLELARFYFRTGQREKGEELLRQLEASEDPSFLSELATIQTQLKDLQGAARSFEKVVTLQPTNVVALNDLAVIYTDLPEKLDRAAQLAERALQLAERVSPTSEAVSAIGDTLGWIYLKRGEFSKGLPLVERAFQDARLMQIAQFRPTITFHYGVALAMVGADEEAKRLLQPETVNKDEFAAATLAILNIDPNAVTPDDARRLEQRLATFPNDVSALLRLAKYQEKTGSPEKAAETYRRVADLARGDNRKSAALLSLARLNSGPLGNKPEASRLAKQAYDLDPRNRDAAQLAGALAWEAGDHRNAALLLEDAGQGSREPALLHQLAWAVYSVGRVNDAQSHLRRMLAVPSAPADLTNSAGRFLTLVKAAAKGPDALAALPIAEDTLSKDAQHVPALMTKAAALEQQKKFEDAAAIYTSITQRWPLFSPAVRNLALLYFEHLDKPKEALSLASKVRDDFPDDARLGKVLGVLAYRAGEFNRAVQYLGLVATEQPDDGEVAFYLARSYAQIGQPARAKPYFQRAAADESLQDELRRGAKAALEKIR